MQLSKETSEQGPFESGFETSPLGRFFKSMNNQAAIPCYILEHIRETTSHNKKQYEPSL